MRGGSPIPWSMRRWCAAALGMLPAGWWAGAHLASSEARWAVAVPALDKLSPGAEPNGTSAIQWTAARGECEGAQILAKAPIEDVRARSGPLRSEGAEPIALALYREAFVEVEQPSNGEGRAGRWPDPLIPAVDPFFGEKRAAFPASSMGPEPVAIYLEVCVPLEARAGLYRAELELTARGLEPMHLPVSLRVRRFRLPATSSLPTTFGFSGLSACVAHGRSADPSCVDALTRLYATSALRHRLSLHGMSMEAPPMRPGEPGRLDFSRYDAELAPFMDGLALGTGARFTATDVRLHPSAKTDDQKVTYWRAFAAHLRERGWLGRAFVYAKDEPRPEDLPEVRRFAALVHRADPDLRVLVTASLDPLLDGAADILAPNLNCLFARGFDDYCGGRVVPTSAYAAAQRKGAELWWYQSCGSHGCGPLPPLPLAAAAYFRGWPSYALDHPAALNRAMGLLAFRHGIGGELYYNTVEAYLPEKPGAAPADPWRNAMRFHGNGDGTLFYPGGPRRVGGTRDIPIESLRLKHLRDGLEDYEYLSLARSLGLEREAQRFAAALAREPYSIERSASAWLRARDRLASQIEAALPESREYPDAGGVQSRGPR